MEIGFLDFGSVVDSAVGTIESTIEFAKLIDELGFSRYWLAEHHENGIAWRSPEILLAVIAGFTERIKIGTAGILLPLNSSLRVAHQFKMLSTLYPGRIDLGIAKGISSENISKELLNGGDLEFTLKEHTTRVNKLCFFLKEEILKGEASTIEIAPLSGQIPEIWLLTTNCIDVSSALFNKTNLSLSLMHFSTINNQNRIDNLLKFADKYYVENSTELKYNITVSMIFSEDKKLAEKIRSQRLNKYMQLNVAGGIEECLDYIYKIRREANTEEIIITPIYNSFEQKYRLSEALALEFCKKKILLNDQ